jgi:hypothetical protein
MRNAGLWAQAHFLQGCGDVGRGFVFPVAEFGVFVEPPAPFDDLRLGLGRQRIDALGGDFGARRGNDQHQQTNSKYLHEFSINLL